MDQETERIIKAKKQEIEKSIQALRQQREAALKQADGLMANIIAHQGALAVLEQLLSEDAAVAEAEAAIEG